MKKNPVWMFKKLAEKKYGDWGVKTALKYCYKMPLTNAETAVMDKLLESVHEKYR